MKELLFRWITKQQYKLTFLDSFIADIEILLLLMLIIFIICIIYELKERRNKKC